MTCGKRREQGQALVYGLFVMTGGLAALYFLFNTGQLSTEKTRLVNTADAVAYSAGVMHARTLNYFAYTNRAMLADTVAIAQLVSLESWQRYADNTSTWGKKLGNPLKYPSYFPSYLALQERLAGEMQRDDSLQSAAEAADAEIMDVLRAGQELAYNGLAVARQQIMDEVAQANYRDGQDGTVIAEALPLGEDAFTNFIDNYAGNERGRFAELAQTAAKRDRFQDSRSWQLEAVYPDCTGAMARGETDRIKRRGGTELLGFDQWKAIDDISEHRWHPRNKYDAFCREPREHIAGWGGQSGAEHATPDLHPLHYDQSLAVNKEATPLAMVQASTSTWDYSGIPSFYDLSPQWLNSAEPALLFPVRLRRAVSQTATSEGRSAIRTTPRLNNYRAQTPGDELVAVSTSKVYFRRPPASCGLSATSRENCSNAEAGGGAHELGSLFNPYWQVGLVQDDSAALARSLQGVALP